VIAVVSPVAFYVSVVVAAGTCAALCIAARRCPGRWTAVAADGIGLVLAVTAVSWTIELIRQGTWSAGSSLPLALCNMAVLVAIAACWTRIAVLVELTWFWGMAGTLQGVLTPDLTVRFPHVVFFEYVVGHTTIVVAAMFLVVGMRNYPRKGAVVRVLVISAAYTAFVGFVDAVTGADYMFLRSPPNTWSLLSLLGPWPWYVASTAAVAVVLFTLLDAPFWAVRRRARSRAVPPDRHSATGAARSA